MMPQNYYARRSVRSRQEVDLRLALVLVEAEREQQPRLGVRKLYHLIGPELRAAGTLVPGLASSTKVSLLVIKCGADSIQEDYYPLIAHTVDFSCYEEKVACSA